LVYGFFVLITAAFVASLTFQVARQIFFGRGAGTTTAERLSPECSRRFGDLARAVDGAVLAALVEKDADSAVNRYRGARDQVWQDKAGVESSCGHERGAVDAMAALARFDRQAEGSVRRHAFDLLAVRREVDSFISTPK
jgi:hypothetical protein